MEQTTQVKACLDSFTNQAKNSLKSMLNDSDYLEAKGEIVVPIGITDDQKVFFQDVSEIPSVLISGTSGSGKTAFVQSVISSIMLQYNPDNVKFLIFDSKMVDYGLFNGSSYLMIPVITDAKSAVGAIEWLNVEANRRLVLLNERKSIDDQPDIFLILDDYCELSNCEFVNDCMTKLLGLARLVKIHCIVITSIPYAKIVPGDLKANIPCRIAFLTVSKEISRMIIDDDGAEKLKAPGEIIFKGINQYVRCQCLHSTDQEIEAILKATGKNEDVSWVTEQKEEENNNYDNDCDDDDCHDTLFKPAVECVLKNGYASYPMLQRELKIGYARAARLIDEMEEMGIVSGYEGSKPRKLIVSKEQIKKILSKLK